jgi:superfamily II DNA or RNA helicase
MNASGANLPVDELRAKLAAVRSEASRLEEEIARLEKRGQLELPPAPAVQKTPQSPAEKVALFLDLFGTRRSVFPKRWENAKTGKSGYAPACDNEWRAGICRKPQIKCTECPHQKFPPLDAHAIEAHLRGIHTLGVYAITDDNSCRFLSADFDGDGWKDNISAYREAGSTAGVPIALERSRSGRGGHAWIFFSEPVPASLARKLGVILLAKASALKPTMGLDAFDRFFPNQDAVSVGGFGNLIALPLAKLPRQDGNTLFLDEEFRPIPDQWEYLASVRRLSGPQLQDLVGKMAPLAPLADQSSSESPDLVLQSDEATLDLTRPVVHAGMLSGELTVRLDSKIHVPRTVPIPVLAALKRLASFANPVFHEKLRLRFPTFDIPRFLFVGEWHVDRLILPRGVLDACLGILERAGATVSVQDQREEGTRCAWKFHGELRPEQRTAVGEMAGHDFGVLCAPPGAGKTVMGCALIARHRTSTLVLVHRSLLLDQWRESAMRFLGLKKKDIGIWKGSKPRITRRLDIAMLPSLSRTQDYASALSGYGLVVVDECHHVPAASFELLLKACPARRIVGLTATPQRKDRLEKLLYLQSGPIRHSLSSSGRDESNRVVVVRRSSIAFAPGTPPQPPIHEVWDALVADEGRLQMIVADISACAEEGRAPLVLADRKSYLDKIEAALTAHIVAGSVPRYRLESGVGKKARANIRQRIDEHYEKHTPFVLLATASLIGEGFDLPQLDTLILAMPLSFKGRLIQYAGRLHRDHEGKAPARIYDYLDENSPLTRAMFRRRATGYKQMGYQMDLDAGGGGGLGGSFEQGFEVADNPTTGVVPE